MSRKTGAGAPLSPASDVEENEQFFDSIESFTSPETSLTAVVTEVGQEDMAAVMLPRPAAPSQLLHEKEVPTSATQLSYARQHHAHAQAGELERSLSQTSQTSHSHTSRLRDRKRSSHSAFWPSQHEPGSTNTIPARFVRSDQDSSRKRNSVDAQHILYDTPYSSLSTRPAHDILQAAVSPADLILNREHDLHALKPEQPHATVRHVDLHTLAALTGGSSQDMDGRNEDLFMQVAEDTQTQTRAERMTSRKTWHDKRHSLTPFEARAITSMEERRPRTSGGLSGRPAPRLGQLQTELGRSLENRRKSRGDADSVVSQPAYLNENITARRRMPTQVSPLSPIERSPEYSRFRSQASARNRRPSQLAMTLQDFETDSPADSSDPKRSVPESASADSQTAASTVWDEVDDLKSRIKKLELVGKIPQTSGAAVSTSPQERPRTATTAPTTIDSSPKRDQKPGDAPQTQTETPQTAYPLLHAALAKAKTLLSPQLYRSLEATATDALQLASMSTAFNQRNFSSGASVVNGGSSGDRQMKRKADTMCRNLTDLCLALCDGKHESPVTSPMNLEISPAMPGRVSRMSPSRSEFNPRTVTRPLSRLEARRTSILGANSLESPVTATSPRNDTSPVHDVTPSHQNVMDRQRYVRSSSRMTAPPQHYDDFSGDEEPTVRAPSRIGSDFSIRSKRTLRDQPAVTPQRSVSLREMLNNRRSSGMENQDRSQLGRVASLSVDPARRRWLRESTPPVLEEESAEQGYHDSPDTVSQPRHRISSFGQFGKLASRRGLTESSLGKSSSLGQRSRQVVVE